MQTILDLSSADRDALARFYLSLDPASRRRRFRGSLTDDAVKRWCRGLDSAHCIIVVGISQDLIEAVVELHALTSSWRIAELSYCSLTTDECVRCRRSLLRLGTELAFDEGCRLLTFDLDEIMRPLVPELELLGSAVLGESEAQLILHDRRRA